MKTRVFLRMHSNVVRIVIVRAVLFCVPVENPTLGPGPLQGDWCEDLAATSPTVGLSAPR